MADSLSTMRSDLRQRIGETSAGTWTNAELNGYLNLAQRKVCEDCILQNRALLTTESELAVEKERYQYALPSDLIDILLLQHYHDGIFYTVQSHPLPSMMDEFNPDSTGTIYDYYAIHGHVAAILDEGVATNTSDSNTLLDNANVDFTTMGLSTIDEVVNLTDGSRATITAVTSATRLTTAGLEGGASNLFRAGDRYQIESGEQYLPQLWVWPPLSETEDAEVEESYTSGDDGNLTVGDSSGTEYQAAQSFQLDDPIQLYSVEIKLGANNGSPLGPVRVEIQTNSGGVPSGTLVAAADPESAASIDSPSASGWNEAVFEEGIRLSASTTYWIVVYARNQATDAYFTWRADTSSPTYTDGNVATKAGAAAWSADTTKDALFRVYGYKGEESLRLHYARYPRTMSNDTDLCEVPMFAYEAILLHAEYLALLKRYGRGGRRTVETLALYGDPRDGVYGTGEIGKIRRLVARRGKAGYNAVKSFWFPIAPALRSHKNVDIRDKLPLG